MNALILAKISGDLIEWFFKKNFDPNPDTTPHRTQRLTFLTEFVFISLSSDHAMVAVGTADKYFSILSVTFQLKAELRLSSEKSAPDAL